MEICLPCISVLRHLSKCIASGVFLLSTVNTSASHLSLLTHQFSRRGVTRHEAGRKGSTQNKVLGSR